MQLSQQLVSGPGELPGYLREYLAEHVNSTASWVRLADQPAVLDGLNPIAVAAEAPGVGQRASLPASAHATAVFAPDLVGLRPRQRGLVRALGERRLGRTKGDDERSRLVWSDQPRVIDHTTLTGHTGWVTGCAFTALPESTPLEGDCPAFGVTGSTCRTGVW